MGSIFIKGAEVYIDNGFSRKTIEIIDSKIKIHDENYVLPDDGELVKASGKKIVPGFIDIHTHGGVGVDVNAANADELEKIGKFFAKNGTTSWLCSVLTDTEEKTLWCIDQFNEYKKKKRKGSDLVGIHLEGPFLAKEYKGAMPEFLLRKFDIDLLKKYQERSGGNVRYLTVAPEVDGIAGGIKKITELGIAVSLGHSGADYEITMKAIENGATASTHTFNAMKLLHQHFPSIMGAVMESDVYCEAICDGRHLHPGVVRLLIKTKGLDRVVAVTDSIMAAGLPDGKYKLGVSDVVVEDGDAKLADTGVRAGSTLTQDVALLNLLEFTGRPLAEVLPILSENPAKLIGIYDRKGSIEDGKDADLVLLDEKNKISEVFVMGQRQE